MFGRYLHAETRRYFKNRYNWITLIVVIALSLLTSFGYAYSANTVVTGPGPDGQFKTEQVPGEASWTSLSFLLMAYGQMGIVFILILNILIGLYYREWRGRTIARTIETGMSRPLQYVARYCHAAATTAAILLVFFVAHTWLLTFMFDTQSMVALYPKLWNYFLAVLEYYLVFLAILQGLVYMTRGGFGAIVLGLVFSNFLFEMIFINIFRLFKQLGPWTGTEVADFLSRYSLQMAYQKVVLSKLNLPIDVMQQQLGILPGVTVAHGHWVFLGYALVFLGLGYLSFRRRPIAE